jgi:hypothetical protein
MCYSKRKEKHLITQYFNEYDSTISNLPVNTIYSYRSVIDFLVPVRAPEVILKTESEN